MQASIEAGFIGNIGMRAVARCMFVGMWRWFDCVASFSQLCVEFWFLPHDHSPSLAHSLTTVAAAPASRAASKQR